MTQRVAQRPETLETLLTRYAPRQGEAQMKLPSIFLRALGGEAALGRTQNVRALLANLPQDLTGACQTTLLTPAATGDATAVLQLLSAMSSQKIELSRDLFNEALQRAALRGHQEIVQLLLEKMPPHLEPYRQQAFEIALMNASLSSPPSFIYTLLEMMSRLKLPLTRTCVKEMHSKHPGREGAAPVDPLTQTLSKMMTEKSMIMTPDFLKGAHDVVVSLNKRKT